MLAINEDVGNGNPCRSFEWNKSDQTGEEKQSNDSRFKRKTIVTTVKRCCENGKCRELRSGEVCGEESHFVSVQSINKLYYSVKKPCRIF